MVQSINYFLDSVSPITTTLPSCLQLSESSRSLSLPHACLCTGVIALFCRQYDIIKDNEPNNNKDKAKNSSECSTPEHPTGGLLRSKV